MTDKTYLEFLYSIPYDIPLTETDFPKAYATLLGSHMEVEIEL